METKDVLTLTASLIAIIVSLVVAFRTWRSNVATFRNASRNNYMTALFDLNRQVITHPQLWAAYDPKSIPSSQDPIEAIRRRAFIWYHLNVFEVVYADYSTHRLTPLSRVDRLCWESWDNFISNVLQVSREARAIVASDDSMRLLNSEFVTYLRDKVGGSPELSPGR